MSNTTRFPARWATTALSEALLVGLLAFAAWEQLLPLARLERIAPALSLATFILTFAPVALAGVGLGLVSIRIVGLARAHRVPIALALALLGVNLMRLFLRMDGEWTERSGFVICGSAVVLLVGSWIGMKREGVRNIERWLAVGSFWGLFLVWVKFFPEGIIPLQEDPKRYLLHAGFLVCVSTIIYLSRIQIRSGRWVEPTAIVALFALVFAIQTADVDERCESPQGSFAGVRADPTKHQPNLVFIVLDTVRRDHMSLYGHVRETTPFLEELAKSSAVYRHAVSITSWTLPAHSSMFTGLYPRSHGAHKAIVASQSDSVRKTPGLLQETETLAEILRDRGYQTTALSANLFVGPGYGLDQGFEVFCEQNNRFYLASSPGVRLQYAISGLIRDWAPATLARFISMPLGDAEQIVDNAIASIDSRDHERPFFLFLNFMDAHDPLFPPIELNNRFPGFDPTLYGVWYDWLNYVLAQQGRTLNAREYDHIRSQYDASLYYLDEQLKRLITELDARGISEDTMLVITSDHGEAFGEHDRLGHDRELYAELLEVPLLIRYPGGDHAGVENGYFENRRIFQAVLEGLGVPVDSETTPWQAASEIYTYGRMQGSSLQRTRRAFYFDHYKFIASSDGVDELYDVKLDPTEKRNIAGSDRAEAVAALLAGRQMNQAFVAQIPVSKRDADADTEVLDPADEELLRALGYIE